MKKLFSFARTVCVAVVALFAIACSSGTAEVYITTGEGHQPQLSFAQIEGVELRSTGTEAENVIQLLPDQTLQPIYGFGAAITGSTCYNLLKMTEEDREKILQECFSPEQMAMSFIRVSIGASDFSLDEYTCCDKEGIEFFELHEYDRRDLLPILKRILEINPSIRIVGSPWSCPKWMKIDEERGEPTVEEAEVETPKVFTTDEEMQGYYIVRAICYNAIDNIDRIACRDTQSYFGILLDDNNRKPICRLHFNSSNKYIETFDAEKKGTRHLIDTLADIYKYQAEIIAALKMYQ